MHNMMRVFFSVNQGFKMTRPMRKYENSYKSYIYIV